MLPGRAGGTWRTEPKSGGNPVVMEAQPHGGMLKRGNTVNLTGRPKMRDTVAGRLREVMLGKDDDTGIVDALIAKAAKGDVRAIELCLHYGIGKPTDKVELSGPEGGPIQAQAVPLTDTERRLLRDARIALDAADGEPEPPEAA